METNAKIQALMTKHHLSPFSKSAYRACLHECFQNGNGIAALQLLEDMKQESGLEWEAKDLQLTIMALCRNNKEDPGLWRRALELLNLGVSDGDSENKVIDMVAVEAYNAVIHCMEDEKEWKEAKQLLSKMENHLNVHPLPTLATYHAVLQVYSAASKPEDAVKLVLSLSSIPTPDNLAPNSSITRKPRPSQYTYELVFSTLLSNKYRRGEYYGAAIQILETMKTSKVPISTVFYNRVMNACAKGRDTSMAMRLFGDMRKQKVSPDTVTFNSLISANAAAGRTRDALELLKECLNEPGVEPDIITYTNAIR